MRIAILLVILAVALFAGIFLLAQTPQPSLEPVQKVIPNDTFQN